MLQRIGAGGMGVGADRFGSSTGSLTGLSQT